jgi:hypothetical protein
MADTLKIWLAAIDEYGSLMNIMAGRARSISMMLAQIWRVRGGYGMEGAAAGVADVGLLWGSSSVTNASQQEQRQPSAEASSRDKGNGS